MRTLITNPKCRWFTSLVAMTVITFAGFFLSNAKSAIQLSAPIYITGGFTFGSTKQLLPGAPVLGFQDVEPEIKVDIFGNIYVTAIEGVPAGVDLWKSIDKGATFVYLGQPDGAQCPSGSTCTNDAGLGGGDDSIDVSNGGYLYVSSLWLGSVTMSASYDGGTGGVQPGQKWEVNPVAAAIPSDDRQWVAAYGPQTVYMSYRQILAAGANASNVIFVAKSTDGGKTFPQQEATFPAMSEVTARREGNLVVDQYTGNIYTSFRPQELNGHTRAELWFLKSTDGGLTWALSKAYQGPAGTDIGNVFPVMAVDRGGNVHLAFSQCDYNSTTQNSSNCQVLLTSSADQGNTWLAPVRVNNGADTSYAILPWIVAGSPGVVDITWYGANITTSTQAADWHLYFSQATNVLSGTPTFNQVQAIPQVVHNQDICLKGGACGGNRDLAEYYQITLDPEGNANIAFTDDVNNNTSGFGRTWYTKQTSGASAYTPPAPPAPATFALNIPLTGGAGAEPSIWVDTHNCIYVTAPGGLKIWRSVNNGASFLPPVNPGGTGLVGGDEDIITLPKADGSRADQVYFADLGLSSVHIRKSTDGGATYFAPGTGGSAGEVSVSSDRQWLAADRIGPDQDVYELDHELASEVIRISSTTNDAPWVTGSGMTDPELSTSVPNTNPGPVFVDKTLHTVFGVFTASIPTTNANKPPFGKLLNIWDAVGNPPAATGGPAGPFLNHPIFKGVIDSPTTPAPPAGTTTFGTNCANIFPAGDTDLAGNLYVAWSMNNARTNEFSIWFASSHDHGLTFYGPFQISQGPGTAIFPWVAAGDNGRVDVVWYQSSTVGDSNTMPAGSTWNTMFSQSLNANTREPVFSVVQASDHIIHTGSISTGGLIGSSDRSLLDFFEVAIGQDGLANIIYADNGLTSTHAEYARQSGGPLAKASPTSPTCLPIPVPTSVVSRKTHTGVGDFDVNLPLIGTRGVECRTGGATGDFKLVFTFPNNLVSVAGASVTSGTGSVSSSMIGPGANQYTVNLTGVTNAQYIVVTLNSVVDTAGNNGPVVGPSTGILLGDTTANGSVNSSDISQTKAQSGTVASSSNFRTDVTINGLINSSDISTVKSKSGTALPSAP